MNNISQDLLGFMMSAFMVVIVSIGSIISAGEITVKSVIISLLIGFVTVLLINAIIFIFSRSKKRKNNI